MGMYTELHLSVELKLDTPDRVLDILRGMLADVTPADLKVDSHPLFSTSRWTHMLRCDSYYFAANTSSTLTYDPAKFYTLNVRCNLKNYDGEIEHFVDWLRPYVACQGFAGFYRYEENEDPTLIYFNQDDA